MSSQTEQVIVNMELEFNTLQSFENFNISAENIENLNIQEKILLIDFVSSLLDYDAEIQNHNQLEDKKIRKIYTKEDSSRRKWLSYQNQKFYCVVCLCFGLKTKQVNSFISGVIYEEPFYRFNQKIIRHENLQYHEASVKQYLTYADSVSISNSQNNCIDDNTHKGKLRIVVEIVIKIVIFLATHRLSFRGDPYESILKLDLSDRESHFRSQKEGNFLGLVKLLSAENPVLAEYVKTCQKEGGSKPTFMSPYFINKILFVTRNEMVKRIVMEIKDNGNIFGLEMDTTQDVSTKDQCSIVVRYINATQIFERTVVFLQNKKGSGEALFHLLQSSLKNINLSMENLASFSFDGASNMRFTLTECIKKENPKTFYTWCFSHRLNLVIKSASNKIFRIKVLLGLVEETAVFIKASYIRSDIWTDVATNTPNFKSSVRLKLIGQTRWSSKHNAINNVVHTELHLFVLIRTLVELVCLDSMDGKALVTCCNLLSSWLDAENILLLVILHKVFIVLDIATKRLQSRGLHILEAVDTIKDLYTQLQNMKLDLEIMLVAAKDFVEKVNEYLSADEYIKSLNMNCEIKIIPSGELTDEFIISIIDNFLDELLCALKSHFLMEFNPDQESIFREFSFLDLKYLNHFLRNEPRDTISLEGLCTLSGIANEAQTVEELCRFTEHYRNKRTADGCAFRTKKRIPSNRADYFPLAIESEADLDSDLDNENAVDIQDVIRKKCYCIQCVLKHLDQLHSETKAFENIHKLYRYVAVLPCTEVKCESTFSNLKLTKTRLRSTINETNLQNLMIISSESDLLHKLSVEDIIREISKESVQLTNKLL